MAKLSIELTEELHQQAKQKSVKYGITLRSVVTKLLNQWVKKGGK